MRRWVIMRRRRGTRVRPSLGLGVVSWPKESVDAKGAMKRLLGLAPLLGAFAFAGASSADEPGSIYSLYRNSWVSREKRAHVATFDAFQTDSRASAAYNADNCNLVARLFNELPGNVSRFWCELGRYRDDRRSGQSALSPAKSGTRAERRRQSAAACSSAVATRSSSPEDLATACTDAIPERHVQGRQHPGLRPSLFPSPL
jgi:hypothetical protein